MLMLAQRRDGKGWKTVPGKRGKGAISFSVTIRTHIVNTVIFTECMHFECASFHNKKCK